MLSEIIKGLSMALNAAFGDEYEIYQNDVEQGLREPCFFIAVLKPEIDPLPGNREIRRYPLDVQYFPVDPGGNAGMISTAERMAEALRILALPDGDLLRGTGMSYEIADNVLHFFVNYNLSAMRPVQKTAMETLETRIGVQGQAVR